MKSQNTQRTPVACHRRRRTEALAGGALVFGGVSATLALSWWVLSTVDTWESRTLAIVDAALPLALLLILIVGSWITFAYAAWTNRRRTEDGYDLTDLGVMAQALGKLLVRPAITFGPTQQPGDLNRLARRLLR